jgi:hypothetical protein
MTDDFNKGRSDEENRRNRSRIHATLSASLSKGRRFKRKMMKISHEEKSASLSYAQDFAEKSGLRIPDELLEFLIGAKTWGKEIKTYASQNGSSYVIHEFLTIGSKNKKGTFESAIEDCVLEMPIIPVFLIPFAIDEGGDFYCISSRADDFGKIYFFWQEFCDDLERAMEFVAPSLEDFIAGIGDERGRQRVEQ